MSTKSEASFTEETEWTPKALEDYYKKNPELRPKTVANADYFHMANPAPSKYRAQRNHPEKDLEQFVHDTARAFGLLYYHTYRSRYSEPGFPDCIILGKWMLVVELKDTGKNLTPAQTAWLIGFKNIGIKTKVWRPKDKDEILLTLSKMRQ